MSDRSKILTRHRRKIRHRVKSVDPYAVTRMDRIDLEFYGSRIDRKPMIYAAVAIATGMLLVLAVQMS